MADKYNVKSSRISEIFDSMEYGENCENMDKLKVSMHRLEYLKPVNDTFQNPKGMAGNKQKQDI